MIILNTKKTIFLSKLQNSIPSLFKVKLFTKNMYDYEELKYTLQDKVNVFEKNGVCSLNSMKIFKPV